jgi:hypothetical protein
MASILDQIKRNALPAGAMRSAAKGALPVPPAEMVEILVYLTHNPVFGQDAKMTLAGWDLSAATEIVKNSSSPPEVLGYFWGEGNRRPALMPFLIENPAISESMLMELAGTAPREIVQMLLASSRARSSPAVMESLATNPRITPDELTQLQGGGPSESELAAASGTVTESSTDVEIGARVASGGPAEGIDAESDTAHEEWLQQHAAEIAAEEGKAFQLTGEEIESSDPSPQEAYESTAVESEDPITPAPVSDHLALAALAAQAKRTAHNEDARKLTPLQKISRLSASERVKLAFTGNKEERAILIRDGAKIVQNSVLASPKLTDPEVETFASAKNLSENVFREIARNRRYMKNYHVVRNLVQNPRTPLDIALPLVKMLLVYDLKGMQHSRSISETIRKLAQKYYKEKALSGGKTKE